MAALVYVFKIFLRTPIKLPGHTAIFWVIPFIIGIGLTRKFGSGTYIGVLSGLLIGFVGMADTGPFKVFEYTAMGLTMDILALAFKGHLTNPLVGFILGAFGSFDKMLVNYSSCDDYDGYCDDYYGVSGWPFTALPCACRGG